MGGDPPHIDCLCEYFVTIGGMSAQAACTHLTLNQAFSSEPEFWHDQPRWFVTFPLFEARGFVSSCGGA